MYEVVELSGEWIVKRAGLELGRYDAEAAALKAMADRLRQESGGDPAVAFAMRFRNQTA
jgi:hypothetical protein